MKHTQNQTVKTVHQTVQKQTVGGEDLPEVKTVPKKKRKKKKK